MANKANSNRKPAKKFDRTNSGIINAVKRKENGREVVTDLVNGKINVGGEDLKINGSKGVDGKGKPVINFSITQVVDDDAFGDVQVVSDDGLLKLNTNRMSEKAPVWRGAFTLNGEAYRASGWIKEHHEYGKFISLSVQTEAEYQAIIAERRGADDANDETSEVNADEVDV